MHADALDLLVNAAQHSDELLLVVLEQVHPSRLYYNQLNHPLIHIPQNQIIRHSQYTNKRRTS